MLISILITLSIAYFIFMYRMRKGWEITTGSIHKTDTQVQPESTKIALIIACRNEEGNLERLFDSIQRQNYPVENLEIVIVDDFSTDNSPELISAKIPLSKFKIQLIELSKIMAEEGYTKHNKKIALSRAIESSSGELIICTDADVWMGENWLATIAKKYEETKADFITGPVLFPASKSIWNQFLEYDQINNIAFTAGSIGIGHASMSNGANMAFTRSAWTNAGGYNGIEDKPSGDDMMLMHRIQKMPNSNIAFNENNQSIVWTECPSDFSAFIHQRVRWFSKVFQYEDSSVTIGLALGYLYHFGIILALFLSFFNSQYLFFLIMPKILVDSWFILSPLNYYNRGDLVLKIPLFSLLSSFYIAGIGSIALFFPYRWKGQKR